MCDSDFTRGVDHGELPVSAPRESAIPTLDIPNSGLRPIRATLHCWEPAESALVPIPPEKSLATVLGEMIGSPSRQKPFHAPPPAARSVNTRCTTTSPSVSLLPKTYRNPNAKPIKVFSPAGKRTYGSRGSSNLCRMMLQHGLLLTASGKIAEFNSEQRHRVHNTNSSHISNTTRRDPTFHIRSLRAASNRADS